MSKEEAIVRITIDCKESFAQRFKILQIEMSTAYNKKSYGDVLEELITFYDGHTSARPKFNI